MANLHIEYTCPHLSGNGKQRIKVEGDTDAGIDFSMRITKCAVCEGDFVAAFHEVISKIPPECVTLLQSAAVSLGAAVGVPPVVNGAPTPEAKPAFEDFTMVFPVPDKNDGPVIAPQDFCISRITVEGSPGLFFLLVNGQEVAKLKVPAEANDLHIPVNKGEHFYPQYVTSMSAPRRRKEGNTNGHAKITLYATRVSGHAQAKVDGESTSKG